MPTANIRPLTAKEQSAIEFYCETTSETFNNWGQSYLKAGYSKCKGWERNGYLVRNKDVVVAGIEAYKGKAKAQTARTVQSVDAMYQAGYDVALAQSNPSGMATNTTGIAKLYAMLTDVVTDKQDAAALTPDELETLRDQAKTLTKPNIKLNTA